MKSALITISILAAGSAIATASDPQFIPTGHLPGVPIESQMLGVSGDGVYAVGRTSISGFGSIGTGWTESAGLFSLQEFGHGLTIAYSASNTGVLVGMGSGSNAMRWTQSSGSESLGFLPGTSQARAHDITSDGTVIVGDSGTQAYRWSESTGMQSLGSASFLATSNAQAVSDDGLIVAGEGNGVGGVLSAGWIWKDGEFTDIGHMGTGVLWTRVFSMSEDGSTVVGWSLNANFQIEAFRWTANTGMVGLGALDPGAGSFESFAKDVTPDGSIIVGGSRGTFTQEAFIWTEATGLLHLQTYLEDNYNMNFGGWLLQEATGISDDGTVITGYGNNPLGGREGWVIILPQSSCLGDIADDFGFTVAEGGGPDGVVDFGDFAALLGLIGPCDGGVPGCLGDIADDFGLTTDEGGGPDGVVDFGDFAALLGLIGPCL